VDIPPDALLALAAVADLGGVTAAARELRLTQPAVSNRLRALEAVVGRPVVTRCGRGVMLTAAGQALLPHARAVARATMRANRALVSGDERRVSVALSDASLPVVMPRLAGCVREPPKIELRVVPCDASSAVQAVVAGDVELAVVVAPPEPPADDLPRRPVLVDEIVLVGHGPQPAFLPLTELRGLTLLLQAPGSGVRATAERVFEATGVWPAHTVELGSSLGALAAAAAGQGCALLARSFASAWVAAGRVAATSLETGDLYARFELISEPRDNLTETARRVYDGLLRPVPRPDSGRGTGRWSSATA